MEGRAVGARDGVPVGPLVGGKDGGDILVGARLGAAPVLNDGIAVSFAGTAVWDGTAGDGFAVRDGDGALVGASLCPKVEVALESNIKRIRIILFGFPPIFRDLKPVKWKCLSCQNRPAETSDTK